jgi:hypothetical protein
MAVVGHKHWHAQVCMHRVRVQMQTPDDFCLGFPCRSKLMHPACASPSARHAEDEGERAYVAAAGGASHEGGQTQPAGCSFSPGFPA